MIGENGQRLDEWTERLGRSLERGLVARRRDLAAQSSSLRPLTQMISTGRAQLSEKERSLNRSIGEKVKAHTMRLESVQALLESYSYERVLDRGFALVSDKQASTVARVMQVGKGENINIRLADGSFGAVVTSEPQVSKSRAKNGQGDPL